jgi:hypothetical protein
VGDHYGLSLKIGGAFCQSADSTGPDQGIHGWIALQIPHSNPFQFHLATQAVRETRFAPTVTRGVLAATPVPSESHTNDIGKRRRRRISTYVDRGLVAKG